MADEIKNAPEQEVTKVATEESKAATGEVTDRGLFNFSGKEELKPEEMLESVFENQVQISEPVPEIKHRSDSSSISISELPPEITHEEESGLLENLPGYGKKPEDALSTTAATPVNVPLKEKKGILKKIKEKLRCNISCFCCITPA